MRIAIKLCEYTVYVFCCYSGVVELLIISVRFFLAKVMGDCIGSYPSSDTLISQTVRTLPENSYNPYHFLVLFLSQVLFVTSL